MKPNPFASLNHFTVPRLRMEPITSPHEACSAAPFHAVFDAHRDAPTGRKKPSRTDALPRIRGLWFWRCCYWKLLQRSDTDPCFEPCRVPALKPRQRVRGNTIAGFQSESNMAGRSDPNTRMTVDPG